MDNKPKTFRVASNGSAFKIQKLTPAKFLWWKWKEWVDVGNKPNGGYSPIFYNTAKNAQQRMTIMQEEADRQTEWTDISLK